MKYLSLLVLFLIIGWCSPLAVCAQDSGSEDSVTTLSPVEQARAEKRTKAEQQFDESTELLTQGESEQSKRLLVKALRIYHGLGDTTQVAETLSRIGWVYMTNADYYEALTYFVMAWNIKEVQEVELAEKAMFIYNLGAVFSRTGAYSRGLEYLQRAKSLYVIDGNQRGVADCLNAVATIHLSLKKPEQALSVLEESADIYLEIGDSLGLSSCYNNMAAANNIKRDYEAVKENLLQALAIREDLGVVMGTSVFYLNLGNLSLQTGDTEAALEYLTKCEEMAEVNEEREVLLYKMALMTDYYKMTGDHLSAFQSLEKYHRKKEKWFGEIATSKIDSLGNQVEKIAILQERREKDDLLAFQKRKIRFQVIGSIVGTIVFLLICFAAVYLYLKQKSLNKREKEIFESKRKLAEAEMERTVQKSKSIKDELSYKKQDLLRFATAIQEKNDFFTQQCNRIRSIEKHKLPEKEREELHLIQREMEQYLTHFSWQEDLMTKTEMANQTFIYKLQAVHPNLTPKDIRLITLVILGLSSKEMASILGVAASSADVMKYRLKKKLDLPASTVLKVYLVGLVSD